jgi:hypothetical protein
MLTQTTPCTYIIVIECGYDELTELMQIVIVLFNFGGCGGMPG